MEFSICSEFFFIDNFTYIEIYKSLSIPFSESQQMCSNTHVTQTTTIEIDVCFKDYRQCKICF